MNRRLNIMKGNMLPLLLLLLNFKSRDQTTKLSLSLSHSHFIENSSFKLARNFHFIFPRLESKRMRKENIADFRDLCRKWQFRDINISFSND